MKASYTLIQIFFLLFCITGHSQTVDKTKDVGEIPYSISSSPSGAFTYTIPIDIYPGKNGTQPSLNLSYNSQNLNVFSVLGLGWSLGGLSEISRCQLSNYYDNVDKSSPIKDGINAFTLDGSRLVNSNSTNYDYQTDQNNIYVKKNTDYTKFEVYFPNGTIAYYGIGSNKYSYPITKLVDPLGNYIDYTYSTKDNRFYIEQISYSSNQNIKIGEIRFSYVANDFEKFVYVDGLKIKTTQRISKIDCYFGSTLKHSYAIGYKKNGNNYFLQQLDYISSGKYLNPLTFEYGNGIKPDIQNSEHTYNNNVEVGAGPKTAITVNWDAQSSKEGYFIFPSDLARYEESMYIYSPDRGFLGNSKLGFPTTESILVGDVNGDLNDEVIKIDYDYQEGNKKIWIRTIDQYSFAPSASVNLFSLKDIPENRTFLLGDFSGKGKADIMMIAYGKDSKGGDRNTTVSFIDIEKGSIIGSNTNYFKILKEDRLELLDFDGDGSVELLHINSTGARVYKIDLSGTYTLLTSLPISLSANTSDIMLFGDINNDGKTDILMSPKLSTLGKCYIHMGACTGGCVREASAEDTFKSKGASFPDTYMGPPGQQCLVRGVEDCFTTDGGTTWTIYYSNGKDKFDSRTFSNTRNMFSYNGNDQFILIDADGDNFIDLIRVSKFDNKISVNYNQGDVFASNASNIGTPIEGGKLITTRGSNRYGNRGKGFALLTDKIVSMYYDANQENNQLLMSKTSSSYGTTTELVYNKIDNSLVYDGYSSNPTYPWARIPYGIDLLSNVKTSVNNTIISHQSYKYKNGIVHLKGLGFNGFEQTITTDKIDDTRSNTQQYDPENWSVLKSEKSSLYENSYDYNFTIGANKARVVTLKKKTEKDILKDQSVTTDYIYDTYGNPIKETISFGNNTEKITELEYNNIPVNPYLLGQLKGKKVTNKLNGVSATTKTSSLYNTNNQIESQKSYYEDSLVSENTFTYNAHNDLYESKSKTYTSTNELVTKSEFDNIGRIKRQTDPLGLYIDYVYNAKGELEYVKNHKGHATKHEYDSWGRKIKTTYPDGTIESIKMDWTSNAADLGNLDPNYNYGDLKIGAPLSKGTTIVACHSISLTPGFSHKAGDKGALSLKIDPNSCSTPPTQSTYNNPLYVVTVTRTGSPTSQVFYDALGRELRKGALRFDGRYLYTDIIYDDKGRVQKESLPFKGQSPSLWNTYSYDKYNRMTSLSYASLKKDSISYDKNNIRSIIDSVLTTKTYNVLGQIIEVADPAGTITYNYRPDGQLASIIPPHENTVLEKDITTSFNYDEYGRQTAIIDPSAGTKRFGYDAAGNINKETDARGKITNMVYDSYNRIEKKEIVGEQTINYNYNADNGKLSRVSSTNETSTSYIYDNLLRLYQEVDSVIDGKWLQKTFSYANGNVSSIAYKAQSGDIVTENYTYTNGHHTETKLNNATSIWKLTAENSMGMPTTSTTGVLSRTYGYDNYGLPTSRIIKNGTTVIQNFGYNFSAQTGNLNWRKDNIRNIQENFGYDELKRLTTINNISSIAYDIKGNTTSKVGLGTFEYNLVKKPYAVTDIIPGSGILQTNDSIAYNNMMRPSSITQGTVVTSFTYNGNADRVKMHVKNNGVDQLQRYYVGGQYEIDVRSTGTEERLYLEGDAYSAPAVYVRQGTGAWQVQYIGRDYLGSITHVIDATGVIKQELSYDSWGRLRNPVNQVLYASGGEIAPILGSRGYTGHEHLINFGLINMNARLYDPVVGRFLSPDPYVQAPDFSQNFNRYSYALNNPLRYTDPNGEFFWVPFAIGFAAGYAIHGIGSGNWGLPAIASGTSIGLASSAIFGAALGASLSSTFQGTNFFLNFGSRITPYVATMAYNKIIPPMSYEIGDFTFSASLGFGFGTSGLSAGVNWGMNYSNGNLSIGGGIGGGNNYSGWKLEASYNGWGGGYGKTNYEASEVGGHKFGRQSIGTITTFFNHNSFSVANDVFGDGGDRWRSNAVELNIGRFSLGTYIYTNNGAKDGNGVDYDAEAPLLGKNKNGNGAWKNGRVYTAPLWLGYRNGNKVTRIGYSHSMIQNLTQNLIHTTKFGSQNYYLNYDEFTKGGYFYSGYSNPYSLWER